MGTLNYQSPTVNAAVEVRMADMLDGLARDQMIVDALAARAEDPGPSNPRAQALQTLAVVVYPTLMAASSGVVIVGGKEQTIPTDTIDQFINLHLPEELVRAWLDEVYNTNPHWRYQAPEEDKEAALKKAQR